MEETKAGKTASSVIFSSVIKDANPFALFNPAKELDQWTGIVYTSAAYISARADQLLCSRDRGKPKQSDQSTDLLTGRCQFTKLWQNKRSIPKKVALYSYSLLWFGLLCRMKTPLPFIIPSSREVRAYRRPMPEAQERISQSDVQNTDVLLM